MQTSVLIFSLGEEALDLDNLARRRKQTLGGSAIPMGWATSSSIPTTHCTSISRQTTTNLEDDDN